MASIKQPSSRYNAFDSNCRHSSQSNKSDTSLSSSTDLTSSGGRKSPCNYSRALVALKSKPSDDGQHVSVRKGAKSTGQNATAMFMVKKFLEKRSSSASKAKKGGGGGAGLIVPADFIAEDLKKTMLGKKGSGGSNFTAMMQKKLFGTGSKRNEEGQRKALTEVKANTRTLAMVLRSERELLSLTKEQESQISALNLMLEQKNREVEKLKDLCLKQRHEIKSLKDSVLFPDVTNSQLQDLLVKQGSELKQAKQLIPSLQRQVTSLTGQLQCLAEDLAEVKADKYAARDTCWDDQGSSPRTPVHEEEEPVNSLDLSSGDFATVGSSDDMLLKDLNPCLTPYYAQKMSKEFDSFDSPSPEGESSSENLCVRRFSKSSECRQFSRAGGSSSSAHRTTARRSEESKLRYGKQQLKHRQFF